LENIYLHGPTIFTKNIERSAKSGFKTTFAQSAPCHQGVALTVHHKVFVQRSGIIIRMLCRSFGTQKR